MHASSRVNCGLTIDARGEGARVDMSNAERIEAERNTDLHLREVIGQLAQELYPDWPMRRWRSLAVVVRTMADEIRWFRAKVAELRGEE